MSEQQRFEEAPPNDDDVGGWSDDQATGEVRRRTLLASIARTVYAARPRSMPNKPLDPRWYVGEDDLLGTSLVRETILAAMKQAYDVPLTAIADRLYKRLKGNPPLKVHGAGRVPYTKTTYENWLRDGKVNPNASDMARMLDVMADLLAEKVPAGKSRLIDVRAVMRLPCGSIEAFLDAVFQGFDAQAVRSWRSPSEFLPSIGPSFRFAAESVYPEPLVKAAAIAREFLQPGAGPRVLALDGPLHCGKKTTLRFLLESLDKNHLQLEDGSRVPALAISVEDHTVGEFIDRVYRFYASAVPNELGLLDAPEHLRPREKVERIRKMASRIPACVLLADVASVEGNDTVRGLSGDLIADVVASSGTGRRRRSRRRCC